MAGSYKLGVNRLFICDKNHHCIGCDYEYADKIDDIDKEFSNCEHLIEVEQVIHSRWIGKEIMIKGLYARNYYCENCKNDPLELGKRCNNCGAIMDLCK